MLILSVICASPPNPLSKGEGNVNNGRNSKQIIMKILLFSDRDACLLRLNDLFSFCHLRLTPLTPSPKGEGDVNNVKTVNKLISIIFILPVIASYHLCPKEKIRMT